MTRRLFILIVGGICFFGIGMVPREASAEPPAETWVAWQSTREEGRTEIYLSKADGSGRRRLTHKGGQRSRFAADGRWISFQGTHGDESKGFVMRPDGSGRKEICAGFPRFWIHDNTGLVCQVGQDFLLVDPDTGASQVLFRQHDFSAIGNHMFQPNGITHDGRYLVAGTDLYRPGYSGTNGTFKASFAAVVLDLEHKDRVFYLGYGCWPFTPPAGERIYHICGNCPTKPDIYRMNIADLATRASYEPEKAHADADWGHEYNPDISNDNRWVAYMASTGCHSGYSCDYEIFLHELGTDVKTRYRVTHDTHFDGYPTVHRGKLWRGGETPQLVMIPNRLRLNVAAGKTLVRTITLRNAAGGTLAPITAEPSRGDLGIALRVLGAGNAQTIEVTVDPKDVVAGDYAVDIAIASAGAINTPQTLPIVLHVTCVDDGGICPPGGDGHPSPQDDAGAPPLRDEGTSPMEDQGASHSGGGCAVGDARADWNGALWVLGFLFCLVANARRRRPRDRDDR